MSSGSTEPDSVGQGAWVGNGEACNEKGNPPPFDADEAVTPPHVEHSDVPSLVTGIVPAQYISESIVHHGVGYVLYV